MDKFKLIDDAAYVFDANGAALNVGMIDHTLVNLGLKQGGGLRETRVVAPPEQTRAYARLGYVLTKRPQGGWLMHNGLPWLESVGVPTDTLLVEAEGTHAVIKNLAVRTDDDVEVQA